MFKLNGGHAVVMCIICITLETSTHGLTILGNGCSWADIFNLGLIKSGGGDPHKQIGETSENIIRNLGIIYLFVCLDSDQVDLNTGINMLTRLSHLLHHIV